MDLLKHLIVKLNNVLMNDEIRYLTADEEIKLYYCTSKCSKLMKMMNFR